DFTTDHRHDERAERFEVRREGAASGGQIRFAPVQWTSVTVSFLGKPSVMYNVPSGTLKVPVINGGFQITAASSVTVQLTLSFNNSEILAMNGNLAPVATAKVA